MISRAYVKSDGSSNVPYQDMAERGSLLELTPELQAKVENLARAAKLIEDIQPRYAIRLMFKTKSQHEPFLGILTAWMHGGVLDGAGEQLIYFCTNKVESKSGGTKVCSAPITPALLGNDIAVCEVCKRPVKPEALCGQVMARLDLNGWSDLLYRVFLALECDADIRMTYETGSLMQANQIEHEKVLNGDVLNKVRGSRRTVIYGLKRIVEDTGNGSSVLSRFKAFLGA